MKTAARTVGVKKAPRAGTPGGPVPKKYTSVVAVRVIQSRVLQLNKTQRKQLRLCANYCAMYMVPRVSKREQTRNESALAFLKLLLREALR